jgi:LmbE family N-acetylglucosaminyl deacetylase
MNVVVSVSPHPDDELVGAGATLLGLRAAGWRVVNLACSLGRAAGRARRRAELTAACERAGFELVVGDGLPPIGRDDDLAAAQRALTTWIGSSIDGLRAPLVIGPSPHDGHHGHEVVGRAIRDAAETRAPLDVMFYGVWGELPLPNVLVAFGPDRLADLQCALSAHAGELARNRYDRLVEHRGAANAVLGPERVFGFGSAGGQEPYAELLMHVSWDPVGGRWTLGRARRLDLDDPLAGAGVGPEVGWWLHARSVRASV